MRSKARIKNHPIHPMLVGFPIAFLLGAFLADMLGSIANLPLAWQFGALSALAGIATALAAAVPGFIDYLYVVPPRSSAKRRATWHMTVNLASVSLFVIAWIVRGGIDVRPGPLILLLEAGGVVLLTMGGWMGGTLVYRNFIGAEHRYPQASKWHEQRLDPAGQNSVTIQGVADMKPDQMRLLHVNGRRIVLARTPDGFAAFDDHCSHRGASLADGVLICNTVQCLWHGSRFDILTGDVRGGPAEKPIKTYSLQTLDDNRLRLTL